MRGILLVALACLAGCGDRRAAVAGASDPPREQLERRLVGHWHVLAHADEVRVCRLADEPEPLRAREPAPATEMQGSQRVEALSAPLSAAALRQAVDLLTRPAGYVLSDVPAGMPAVCTTSLLVRRGEDLRIVLLDLENGVAQVHADTHLNVGERLVLTRACAEQWRVLTSVPLQSVPR